jgi:CRP-like cAMP-binding protein
MSDQFLEGIPFLAELPPEQRQRLGKLFDVREFAAQEVIVWMGAPGDEFFVVKSGQVSISVPDTSGKEIVLAELGAGAFFGEISLLDSGPRTATVRARTPVTVLALGGVAFGEFVMQYPAMALHMLRVLGNRQRQTVEKLRGIRNLNEIVEERLTTWQKVASGIARMASSQAFLMTHAVLFGSWISLNIAMGKHGPDPFPFPFLCFWTSCEAIFLSLFILVAQDQQTRKDRMRTELDYQVAVRMQLEISQLHRKVDQLLDPPQPAKPAEIIPPASHADTPVIPAAVTVKPPENVMAN